MARVLKVLAILAGLALAVVAGMFGAVIVALILVAAAVFSLFGKGKVNVAVNRAPRGAAPNRPDAPPPPAGDVIDIEATKVEPPKRELT
ncbi:MAG: hypothetical protein C0502_04360 [Opitutus sp.]|nr:hypothetical protein [Opitutus sp.]